MPYVSFLPVIMSKRLLGFKVKEDPIKYIRGDEHKRQAQKGTAHCYRAQGSFLGGKEMRDLMDGELDVQIFWRLYKERD